MVLEATMICIDNSEWMRNGDYAPSRLQAQADAVNLILGAKTQLNPENTVGILTTAGKGVRVLTTPTSDLGKILACMHGLEVGGEMNLVAGIQIAQLALKHLQNKHQQQRIIVFAGSPIKYEKNTLEMIGKKLKKNSVALDIVNFGEEDDGKPEKLEKLLAAVNNNDSSHIVHIPPGPNALSDVLISTPVLTGDGGSGFAASAATAVAAGGDFDFGVDPNIDPELAYVLRQSMQEERARQEAAAKRATEEAARQEKGEHLSSNCQDDDMVDSDKVQATETAEHVTDPMDEESALLLQAIALSMENPASDPSESNAELAADMNVDSQLSLAFKLSMRDAMLDEINGSPSQLDVNKALEDQSFMSSVLALLPRVDPNYHSVNDLLAPLGRRSEKDEDESSNDDE